MFKNWNVINDWNATITGWLDPNSGGSSSINTQDVFAVGANGHLFDYHWSSAHWETNDLGAPATGVTLVGTPSSNTFTSSGQPFSSMVTMAISTSIGRL